MAAMGALRCSMCSINWPPDPKQYRPCPVCQGTVSWIYNAQAIDAAEARTMRLQAEFDRYYEARPTTQPQPE